MAKLQEKNFNKHFIEEAKIAAGTYLFECLTTQEQERCKEEWENTGRTIPWYKWCIEHIQVKLDDFAK